MVTPTVYKLHNYIIGDIRIVDVKTGKTEKIMNVEGSKPHLIRWNSNSV